MCTYLYNILLQARATTMMPSKIGLGAILTMIFAPKVELRVDRTVQRYTGCLVGLGHHAEDHQDNLPKAYAYESPGLTSYNADHDMELTFDSEISNYDIELIQKIRFLMNNAFSIDPRKGQGFKKISAENEIIKVKKNTYLFENNDCLIAHFHITYISFSDSRRYQRKSGHTFQQAQIFEIEGVHQGRIQMGAIHGWKIKDKISYERSE